MFLSFRLFKTARESVILFWIFAIMIGCTAIREYRIYVYNINSVLDYSRYLRGQVVTRLDSIMVGFMGAYLAFYKVAIWQQYKKPSFIAGIVLLSYPALNYYIFGWNIFFINHFLILSQSLGTLLVLPQLCAYRNGKGTFYRFFTHTSKISYSMYLLHSQLILYNIMINIVSYQNNHWGLHKVVSALNFILYIALIYGLATALYNTYEKRLTNLRDRFVV
jgi:peptidoglycan/LPS O-acetylase OafA/YrhL